MKTSNKLLLGLIIAILLMATIFVGLVKYYHVTAISGMKQTSERNTDELSFQGEAASGAAALYFPLALLQPPLR